MEVLQLTGTITNGWWFLGAVSQFRKMGYRATEVV